MSDKLPFVYTGESLPEFISRLRSGRFVSPSGVESAYLTDSVSRTAGKKAAQHEITDSDDSVLQDLGAGTWVYPMNVYFVGDNYDKDSDAFVASLFERYSPDNPGILKHPRWGDLSVMPFNVDQSESFIEKVGIGYVSVEFRQTKSLSFPSTSGVQQSVILNNVSLLQEQVEEAALEINVESESAYSRFRSGINAIVKTITDALDSISEIVEDVQEEVNSIKSDIYSGLDNLAAPALIFSQIGNLLMSVAEIVTDTPDKINAYLSMTKSVLSTYSNQFETLVSSNDKKNAAITLESLGGVFTSASVAAAINTDFSTREAVGDVIDSMVDIYSDYLSGIDIAYNSLEGLISLQFIPNHNIISSIYGVLSATNQLLINRAFDLKTRITRTLTAPSDALTLTWDLYRDINKLDYFIKTNKIVNDEFNEIPSGRMVVAYV